MDQVTAIQNEIDSGVAALDRASYLLSRDRDIEAALPVLTNALQHIQSSIKISQEQQTRLRQMKEHYAT